MLTQNLHATFKTLLLSSILCLSSCHTIDTHTNNITVSNASIPNTTSDKMAALLNDSAKTNNSPLVNQLIKKITQDSNNPDALYMLGYAHSQSAQTNKNLHEHDLAIEYLNRSLELVPGNQVVIRALYNIYYDDTLHQYKPDSAQKAREVFNQLSDENKITMNPPALAEYVFALSQPQASQLEGKVALRAILLKAIQELPTNDYAYIHLAKMYAKDRYFALALATLKLGAENIKKPAELYKAIAAVYEERADINGCSYENIKDLKQSTNFYKLAIGIKPDDANLHQHLSQNYLDQNLNQLGLNEAIIAYELDDSYNNLNTAAQNYALIGKYEQANALLQKSSTKKGNNSAAAFHEVYMDQGNWKKAAESFSAYLKEANKLSVYDLIKSDIIARESGLAPQIQQQKITFNTEWEEKLFNYWTLKINDDALRKEAHNRCEKTEYYFYTGYKDLLDNQKTQAKNKFKEAINQNTYRYIERPLAKHFLLQ